jgi:hypothetical protein
MNMKWIARVRINGRIHTLKLLDMTEWIARKQMQHLCKQLQAQGKKAKLVELSPIEEQDSCAREQQSSSAN